MPALSSASPSWVDDNEENDDVEEDDEEHDEPQQLALSLGSPL